MFTKLLTSKQIISRITIRSLSSKSKLLSVDFNDGVKTVTMCHAKTRNSLSINMMENLIEEITNHQNDDNLRIIVLNGEGPVFSAGHNLKELALGAEKQTKVFELAAKLMSTLIECPVPVIAKIDGLAAAAGCQLVAQCDLAFCSAKSTFSTPGVNFGIFCSTPGVALARCVPKATSMKMLLTGLPISSSEAASSGLVSQVFNDSNELDAGIQTICDNIKSKSRSVLELGKKFYYKQIQSDLKDAYRMGGRKMIENIRMEDGKEGIDSFVHKRKALWRHKKE